MTPPFLLSADEGRAIRPPYGARVRVCWHAPKSCWAVLVTYLDGLWILVGYSYGPIHLKEATFSLNEEGREWVRRTGQRVEHSWVEGTLLESESWNLVGKPLAEYNYTAPSGWTVEGSPLTEAYMVEVGGSHILSRHLIKVQKDEGG